MFIVASNLPILDGTEKKDHLYLKCICISFLNITYIRNLTSVLEEVFGDCIPHEIDMTSRKIRGQG